MQKDFEKNFQKNLQKQNISGASVVQNVKKIKKQSMHILWVVILAQFQATFALTLCKLVQLSTSRVALVCVGINHQKGGDCKGIRLTPTS